ncbi:LysM peptidoglycan-binding domain-containing protein, partial [Halorhodospira neutriphila]|uniref:LysM peptidoglycan-binding domain-containing protein n=1 Tax=Halorhodospira neutriphila TaxID=168379 RepID=UPI00190619D8
MRRCRPRSPRPPATRLLGACLLGAVALAGCTALWHGDWKEEGHRRIYLYEVKPGDTLYRIAWRHGLEPGQLQAWNDIDHPRQLQVGRHLMLNPPGDFANDPPAGGATAAREQQAAAAGGSEGSSGSPGSG